MAGYLFSLDNENSLIDAINKGIFSTRLSHPKIRNGANITKELWRTIVR